MRVVEVGSGIEADGEIRDSGEDHLPGPVDGLSDQPPVSGLEGAELIGKVSPR